MNLTTDQHNADIEEAWLPAVGFECEYLVSNLGRVKFIPRVNPGNGHVMDYGMKAINIGSAGYPVVSMSRDGGKLVCVHRMVAMAFIPNPENKPQVNHKNGIKADNSVNNLEWVSASENIMHAHANGFTHPPSGERHHAAKLNEHTVRMIRVRRNNGETVAALAKEFGMSSGGMSRALTGARWKWIK